MDDPREQRDARPVVVGVAALTLAVGLVVVMILLSHFAPSSNPPAELRVAPPGPLLQVDPTRDLQALRQRESVELSTFGWVDRSRGVCRIPIRLTIRKLAEHGLPVVPVEEGGD